MRISDWSSDVCSSDLQVMLGDYASQELIDAFRRKMGLDLPLWQQYANFIVGLLHGALGRSMVTNQPISQQIISVFPYTRSAERRVGIECVRTISYRR